MSQRMFEFTEEPLPDGTLELVEQFERIYTNGGVVLRCFRADDTRGYSLLVSGVRRPSVDPFQYLLGSPDVAAAAQELEIPEPLDAPPVFARTVALALEGWLAHLMLCGGAYERVDDITVARRIAKRFVGVLADGDEAKLLRLMVGMAHSAWTPWFCRVAWDSTFVVLDREASRAWLLCLTDTD